MVIALLFIYGLNIINLASIPLVVKTRKEGKAKPMGRGGVLANVFLMALEAGAIFVLLEGSDFRGALTVALVVWGLEIYSIVDSIRMMRPDAPYYPNINAMLNVVTLVCATLLVL